MTAPLHVVLGGNGVVGRETLRALREHDVAAVCVGRRPSTPATAGNSESESANARTDHVIADLLDPTAVRRALHGADVAYLVAGLPYSSGVWADQWPRIVDNTVEAALAEGTHLVYLDNVYAYGRVSGPMTEATPINPSGRKGAVRAAALEQLRTAADRGLAVTIGRSADFTGPGATTSVFNGFVVDRIAAGKRPTWLLDADQPHSLTATTDIGDALVVLGTDDRATGRTWHLPTAPALTGRQYVELAGVPAARTAVMSSATLRFGALFNTSARETLELRYQYTDPYVFDSSAFEQTFGVHPTPTADVVAAALLHARSVTR
ncbi:NAD-dependent epimerase/dehydratase family protein [Curtobacterium sp. ME-Dv--P-122a]|uniref:NAD-dependent epimerase/dehydratase family protein n=1 Tax=Curtobacterium sp. ME-Dv--P-122a TaxID=3040286 RepID=UPI00254F7E88|nr:NAD-dependent epimerase/dehydratase family protein [Curtobacterium sp. ME-Dv--P-122a]